MLKVKQLILLYHPKQINKNDRICCVYHALDGNDPNSAPLIRYINSFLEAEEWTYIYEK